MREIELILFRTAKLTMSRWAKSSMLALLGLCFIGLQSAGAQIAHPVGVKGKTIKSGKLAAGSSTQYTDDNSNDGLLYADFAVDAGGKVQTTERTDTVEICPQDAWHHVMVTFTEFDIHTGDVLKVFDADLKTTGAGGLTPLMLNGSGVSNPNANGGWVAASCSPDDNASGCLTFVFETTADNNKGLGWDSWVSVIDRGIKVVANNITSAKLDCNAASANAMVTIPLPTVSAACDANFDATSAALSLVVKKANGAACVAQRDFAAGAATAQTLNLGVGQYTAEWFLTNDKVKTTGPKVFSVSLPALVCNDEVIMRTDLTCGGTAVVEVIRVYTPDGTADCDNGVQTTTCKTTIRFEDQTAPIPVITANINNVGRVDTLIACDEESLKNILAISAIDNCDLESTNISVTLEENDPCFDAKGKSDTTRAFVVGTATDKCGNTGTVRDTFTIIRPSTFAAAKNGKFECDESGQVTQLPGLRVGYVKGGVDVITDTVYSLSTEEYYCGYILTKKNIGGDVPDTDCGTKEFIEWSYLDWCSPNAGLSVIDTQFIEYIDTEAPLFVDTMATRIEFVIGSDKSKVKTTAALTVELDHFSCTYETSKLPKPVAKDNCDANPSVEITRVFRIEDGGNWPMASYAELDCDSFYVEWTTNDICHEQQGDDKVYQIVVIEDVTKPSAACIDQLNVSVPNEWGARVYAKDIDAGSYDACGIKSVLIRIKGSGDAWAEYIDIGCGYVHKDLQIEMQVLDNKDNENICWLDVLVEDKINPICTPLEDKEVYCDDYHDGELGASTDADEDLEMESSEWATLDGDLMAFYNDHFGNPEDLKMCEDNLSADECGDLRYEQQYQLIKWPCGEAKAKRRYRARDWSDLYSGWVEQSITVKSKQDWKITFPGDWEGACGDLAPAEHMSIENGACDLLGYEVTEKQFDIPGDACFKIERTYHVINWCKYVAGDEPVQIARVEGDHGYAEGLMVTSEGNEDKGYWTYIQVLKVHDDVAPVVTIVNPEPCITGIEYDAIPYGEEDVTPGASPFECDEPKTWTATATDCSSNISWVGKLYNAETGTLVQEVATNEITQIVSNKESYFAEFWAYDNCGNSGGDKGDPVKFWDCKKPTPYVLNGIAIELMETGMIQTWATDLNQNSFDNCTDQSKLDFRIWADFLGDAPSDLEGVQALGKVITFDCDRVGTNVVYIYVIDEEGNWDFAQTYVIVQDNMNACDSDPVGGMVAGSIVNPQGENVESVEVSIAGAAQQTITTGADGSFMYILGITQFDSPYKYIAADVNKSGSITAFDMVQLRQLILNITTEFPGNDSWRFVDASHEFTAANAAAENFSEFYTINTLAGNMENVDFVGVKVGDVNGNAKANSLLGAETRSTNGALTLTAADRFVEAGETVTVAFTAADIANAQGYQFTLNFAGQNAKIGEGVAKAANMQLHLDC